MSKTRKTWRNRRFYKVLFCVSALVFTPLMGGICIGSNVVNSAYDVRQQGVVKGAVVDSNNEPIIGANVKVVGTNIGVITDVKGNFSINVAQGAKLLISYMGYVDQTVTVRGGTLRIVMNEDAKSLDEVVVVGYGTVKKRDLTGAVTSMKTSDVTIAPTNNVMEALQGKISGMDIVKPTGQVGEGVNIILRGSRSIYGSNEPLFIIDGIPGSYNNINPSDIESIDVLKDASSTAIYGSAGANGVVIITTKRGKTGKATVNFDAYYGFSGTPNFKHGMVGEEWTNYMREAYKYKNGSYPVNMDALLGNQAYIEAYNAGKWIDWVDEASLGNTATTEKYALSVTAGGDKTQVFASTAYSKDQGLLPNENLKRYSLRLNVDQKLADWIKIGFTSYFQYSDRNQGVKNTYTKSLSSFPLGDARDANGNINHEFVSGQYSPMSDFIKDQFVNNTRSTYTNLNGYVEVKPIKDITFTSRVNATLSNSRRGQYWGDECNALRPSYANSPHASITNNNGWGYTWENILSYNRTFFDDHNVGITALTSWNKNQDEMSLASASGQMVDRWSFWRLISGSAAHVESSFTQNQKMSYAFRINYAYKGRYLLNLSTRWDGVSQFSVGHKWDSFPAAALAWRVSDEAFMKNISWIDNLKLRVGYGVTGNSGGVGPYATSTDAYVYTASGLTLNGDIATFAQYSGTYGSAVLGWEKSYNWNVGLDFGLFNGVIDGSVEWFSTKTDGLLFTRTLPITSGITGWGAPLKIWQNIAKTSNKGVELTLNSHNINKKDFSWDSSLSLSWTKENIDDLPDGDLIAENLFEGETLHSIYGYKYLGIWGTDTPQQTLNDYGVKPGFIKVATIEKDGDGGVHKYGDSDRMVLGHTNPDWIVGLNNSFRYKDFDLSIFAMARYGQTISSSLLGYYTAGDGITTNQLAGVDYWTEENQGAYFPRPGTGGEQSKVYSSFNVRDGSFIKIKNITLGYTLPISISRHVGMQKCRIYGTAYNPFIFVKDKYLKGTDPEMGGSDNFPTYKQFVFGVNIVF